MGEGVSLRLAFLTLPATTTRVSTETRPKTICALTDFRIMSGGELEFGEYWTGCAWKQRRPGQGWGGASTVLRYAHGGHCMQREERHWQPIWIVLFATDGTGLLRVHGEYGN